MKNPFYALTLSVVYGLLYLIIRKAAIESNHVTASQDSKVSTDGLNLLASNDSPSNLFQSQVVEKKRHQLRTYNRIN